MIRPVTFACSLTLTLAALAAWVNPARADWPQWRGPLANWVATGATPPTEWSETKNVKWKVKIPGSGTSTPIILGDKIYLTTAVATGKKSAPPAVDPSLKQAEAPPPPPPPSGGPEGKRRERRSEGGGPPGGPPGGGGGRGRGLAPDETYQFQLLCLDRATGKTLWQQTAIEQLPHEGHHQDHGYASHSPVTDGTHVYAYFGSRGLHCYTLEGKLVWS